MCLSSDGSLFTWGGGGYGQLGHAHMHALAMMQANNLLLDQPRKIDCLDPARLQAFMENVYHRPADEASRVVYGGMVDDVLVQAELVRFFADSKAWPAAGAK